MVGPPGGHTSNLSGDRPTRRSGGTRVGEEDETMSLDLSALDATAQAELVRKGDVTAGELVDAAIARIEKVNGELNAVIIPLFEKARARARQKLEPGPFRGVPFLLKDLVATSAGDP